MIFQIKILEVIAQVISFAKIRDTSFVTILKFQINKFEIKR